MKYFIVFMVTVLSSTNVFALDASLSTVNDNNPSYISAGIQGSTFSLDEGSIEGTGLQVAYNYFFKEKLSMHIDISSALGLTGALQNSYTGINLSLDYGLMGQCCQLKRSIYLNDQIIATESLSDISYWSVGAGLDQHFLNGSQSVYSASGLAFNSKYLFTLFKLTWIIEGKYSLLVSGGNNVSNQSLLLGLVFPM